MRRLVIFQGGMEMACEISPLDNRMKQRCAIFDGIMLNISLENVEITRGEVNVEFLSSPLFAWNCHPAEATSILFLGSERRRKRLITISINFENQSEANISV